jgi:hypothetical protein
MPIYATSHLHVLYLKATMWVKHGRIHVLIKRGGLNCVYVEPSCSCCFTLMIGCKAMSLYSLLTYTLNTLFGIDQMDLLMYRYIPELFDTKMVK